MDVLARITGLAAGNRGSSQAAALAGQSGRGDLAEGQPSIRGFGCLADHHSEFAIIMTAPISQKKK